MLWKMNGTPPRKIRKRGMHANDQEQIPAIRAVRGDFRPGVEPDGFPVEPAHHAKRLAVHGLGQRGQAAAPGRCRGVGDHRLDEKENAKETEIALAQGPARPLKPPARDFIPCIPPWRTNNRKNKLCAPVEEASNSKLLGKEKRER